MTDLEPGQNLWATGKLGHLPPRPHPRWLRAEVTCPGQGILLPSAPRRPRDSPGGSGVSWLWLGVAGPQVLGTLPVEERAPTSVAHKQPLPETSAVLSVERVRGCPPWLLVPPHFRVAELPAVIPSPLLRSAANPLPQPVKPEMPVSQGAQELPARESLSRRAQHGPWPVPPAPACG